MDSVFVARQPIYKEGVQVYAYELLFRNSHLNEAVFRNGDQASAQVLLNVSLDIGLNRVVGSHLAYLNLTHNLLCGDYCALLPKERIVLEVLEDVIPDKLLLESLSKLTAKGYRIALDDFTYAERFRPLLEMAEVVKLDVQAHGPEALPKQLDHLRKFQVKLLAEKVETYEEYDLCRRLGFDYFQGYFFCKPQILAENKVPFNRMAALRLLAKLTDPTLSMSEISAVVEQDVALSYKLVYFINSAFHSLPHRVDSVRHAITLIGTDKLRNWAGLIVFASMDDKPRELMTTASVRARMCELLAMMLAHQSTEHFFTVGLFSVLDAMFDRPMSAILEPLYLSKDVENALLGRPGLEGDVLRCVLAYEQGYWEGVKCRELAGDEIREAYVGAVEWTRTTMQQLAI